MKHQVQGEQSIGLRTAEQYRCYYLWLCISLFSRSVSRLLPESSWLLWGGGKRGVCDWGKSQSLVENIVNSCAGVDTYLPMKEHLPTSQLVVSLTSISNLGA